MINCVIFIQYNIKQQCKWMNSWHDNNIEEFCKHVEWKKSAKRRTYCTIPFIQNSKQIELKDVHRSQDITYLWERRVTTEESTRSVSEVLIIFYFMIWGVVTQVYSLPKKLSSLDFMHFSLCTLYFNKQF